MLFLFVLYNAFTLLRSVVKTRSSTSSSSPSSSPHTVSTRASPSRSHDGVEELSRDLHPEEARGVGGESPSVWFPIEPSSARIRFSLEYFANTKQKQETNLVNAGANPLKKAPAPSFLSSSRATWRSPPARVEKEKKGVSARETLQ